MRSGKLKIASAIGALVYCGAVAFGAGCSSKDAGTGSTGSAAGGKAKTGNKTTTAPKTPPKSTGGTKTMTPAQKKPAAPTPKPPANKMMVAKPSGDKPKTDGEKSTVTCMDVGLTDGEAFCYYDDAGENYVIFCSGMDVYQDWCGNYEPDANTFAACMNIGGTVDCYPQPLDPVAPEIVGDTTDAIDLTTGAEGFAVGLHCPTFFEGKGGCDGAVVTYCHSKDIYAYDCSQVFSAYTACSKDKSGNTDCCLPDGSDCIHSASGSTTGGTTSGG